MINERVAALARSVPVRLVVAGACLAAHVGAMAYSGRTRFHVPFNAAPGQAPAFHDPASERAPAHWDRLVVSRWDAGQYIGLGLRGYKYCPPPPARPGGALPETPACN